MTSGRLKYLPPRFMTINTAIEQLLESEKEKKEVRKLRYLSPDILEMNLIYFKTAFYILI